MRQLGIPTVVDRLVQQAITQALEPLLDPTFSESSFGFRPGRSAHDALRQARGYSARNAGIPMRSSTYFRRALQRSVRSPWAMNAPIMALHTRTASSGGTITPVGRAKSWWPRDAAQTELKIHPVRSAGCTPGQRDVVGISSTAARPPPSNAILNLRGRPYSSLHRRPAKSSLSSPSFACALQAIFRPRASKHGRFAAALSPLGQPA